MSKARVWIIEKNYREVIYDVPTTVDDDDIDEWLEELAPKLYNRGNESGMTDYVIDGFIWLEDE